MPNGAGRFEHAQKNTVKNTSGPFVCSSVSFHASWVSAAFGIAGLQRAENLLNAKKKKSEARISPISVT